MTIHFATEPEITGWNKHILANPDGGNVFQGYELAQQKQLGGWTPRYIIANNLAITALEKSIPSLGKLWYLPKGPGVASKAQLAQLLPQLQQFARTHGVFLVKIEPELPLGTSLAGLNLQPARPIQPNFATVLLDLAPDLDAILKAMPQKGRHAIRRAERDGVTIQAVPATDQHCDIMYNLLQDTAAGAGFGIRARSYYRSFYQRYAHADLGQLFFASFEGQVVAAAFAICFGTKSTYKDGASIRKRTAYGASHLLQWHVIQWAKEHGSLIHDLCGAPPITQKDNPEHPHYGLGLFKTSFNKEITQYVGTLDLPVRPAQAAIWHKVGEKATLRLHNRRHHESFY